MIAFLGMGMLGSNWVRAMRKRGEEVNVWNRTAARAKVLEEVGANVFENAADAVKGATRVHICVSDDAAVEGILAQIVGAIARDTIIVDHTTTTASGAIERTARLKSQGIDYVHAPVFMGPQNALESSGSMLVSGDQAVIAKVEAALKQMTGELQNMGENVGDAAAYKLLGNHNFLSISAALIDSITLGKSLGLPMEDVIGFLEQIGTTPSAARIKRLRMGNYDAPTWELLMARKDARLMVEEATRAHNDLMVMPALGREMDALIAEGLGSKDWSIVAKEAIS